MASSPIIILLTRNNRRPSQDDRILIRRINPSSYDVSYKDGLSNPTKSLKFSESYEGVVTYVQTMLLSLEYDVDPFDFVQFLFPIYPTVMYNVDEVNYPQISQLIMTMLRHSLLANPVPVMQVVSSSSSEDSSSIEDESSDDETADNADTDEPSPANVHIVL